MARVGVVRADDLLVCELELIGVDVAGAAPNAAVDAFQQLRTDPEAGLHHVQALLTA